MAKIFIEDGYTETATITLANAKAAPLKIVYRMLLPEKVYDFRYARRDTGAQHMAAVEKLVMEGLVDWDAELKDGTKAKIDGVMLRRTPTPYLDEIVNHVSAYTLTQVQDDVKN